MFYHIPLLATLLPAILGIILYLVRRGVGKKVRWIATLIVFLSVLLILSMLPDFVGYHEDGGQSIYVTYEWITSPIEVTFGFYIDNISLPIGLIIAIISAFSCLYSTKYMENEHGQAGYYANLLLFTSGMLGVIFSSNLLQFYLFWELMLIPSYFLIAFWGTAKRALNIGFKYFIFTHIGAVCMLLGILSIASYTGTFDLVTLPERFGMIPQNMIMLIFALLLIGLCVKMAIFPLHTWLPDAHAEAPAPISAMLSGAMINCGAYAMIRIFLSMFSSTMLQTSDYLAIIGIVTIIYGGLMALAQTDIKRLLAYSSISQMGYIFFGIGVSSKLWEFGVIGALFHIVNHAICKGLLFMCAGVILHQTGTRDIRKLSGLAGKMPITTVSCLIGALSLTGTPPLSGFWSEWMIFAGGVSAGKVLLTLIAVISSVITAGYYLWFVWRVFFGATPENLENVKEGPWLLLIPIVALTAATVVLGIWPDLLLGLTSSL